MNVVATLLIAFGIGGFVAALLSRRIRSLSAEFRIFAPILGGALALGLYALVMVALR